jgi:kynurenine 3-monooxygenase
MQHVFPAFQTTKEPLPGNFKVVRLNQVPPKVDPTSVSLLLPKKGSTGAFVEPTGIDGSCCILFSGRGESPLLSETRNITVVVEALEAAFPQWEGVHETIAEQLMAQPAPASASSVVCNTYHYGGKAVLVGDAAHATGGVSGQGVNSALMDSVALSECVAENRDQLDQALLSYSKRQVPEGKALFDLSFGPKPKGFKAIILAFENARDTLFRGRFGVGQAPLQTLLTTSLTSFAEIRRERGGLYDEAFPDDSEFLAMLTSLHIEALETSTD